MIKAILILAIVFGSYLSINQTTFAQQIRATAQTGTTIQVIAPDGKVSSCPVPDGGNFKVIAGGKVVDDGCGGKCVEGITGCQCGLQGCQCRVLTAN